MSRRDWDAIVVGGGVVGAACALALARRGARVQLVEAAPPPPWREDQPDLRVYAIAPDNIAWLSELGVWASVRSARAQPYRRMVVWDAAGGHPLEFDADAFARDSLGWIVEHGLLVDRLWKALPAAGVEVACPARVTALDVGDSEPDALATVGFEDGARARARLVIAADGASSPTRELAGIEHEHEDYAQRGIVAYVDTEREHESTCWQRFLPTGPLAFLPCADGRSSIVWSVWNDEAQRLMALPDEAFLAELGGAFDHRLGRLESVSRRAAFPLRRQLAQRYVRGRVVVVGDAAHVVHPLAGQGVNLGLRDVSALVRTVADARAQGLDPVMSSSLRRWARERRSENALATYAFDGLNRLFSNEALVPTLLRGRAMGWVGRLRPVTYALWKRAAGL